MDNIELENSLAAMRKGATQLAEWEQVKAQTLEIFRNSADARDVHEKV